MMSISYSLKAFFLALNEQIENNLFFLWGMGSCNFLHENCCRYLQVALGRQWHILRAVTGPFLYKCHKRNLAKDNRRVLSKDHIFPDFTVRHPCGFPLWSDFVLIWVCKCVSFHSRGFLFDDKVSLHEKSIFRERIPRKRNEPYILQWTCLWPLLLQTHEFLWDMGPINSSSAQWAQGSIFCWA